jgi:hypothetical protein
MAAAMAKTGFAQVSQLSITNYVIIASQRISVTQWQYTYTAAILNQGPALTSATATLTTTVPNIVVVPGHNVLNFGPVPTGSQVQAKNSFTVNVDRTVQYKLTDLHWAFVINGGSTPPVANAGPNEGAVVGSTVTLNGSASTNPSGIGTLSYSWQFTGLPTGSNATLANANTVSPSFIMDVAGTYTIQLTVNNGSASSTANVTVSTDIPPVANAGPNQSVALNALVTLDGSKSTDSNSNTLTFTWTFTQIPAGSAAALNGANTVNPTFTVDLPGKYVVQLVVNDGLVDSAPSSVTIDQNSVPVANAGQNQSNAAVGTLVQLDGSKSTDVDGDPLTYLWSIVAAPANSQAALSANNIVNPTFTPDKPGTYTVQLTVNDGTFNSAAVTVNITTGGIIQPPTANAGLPQKLVPNATVTLDGSGSFDPQNLPLSYAWSFTARPTGSKAVLVNANTVNPTFVGDVSGTFVVQLIVNNGTLSSAASTVKIAIDTPPVANAGSNQTVAVGANVLMNGGASFDADGDTITYSWTFNSKPANSTATLSGANTVAPTFVADLAGTYVLQLIVSDSLTSSNPPATVTVTAIGPKVITLTPNPMTIGTTTGAGTLTVTLANPAGPSGQIVTLASTNTAAATVPNSVTVPANVSTVTVAVTPVAVGTTTITGSATGFTSGTASVNVVTPTTTITLDFPNVGLGGQITGHATLNVPAVYATNVGLSSNPSGIVTSPSSVAIPVGGTTAPFTITGAALGTTTLRGVVPGYTSVSISITVVPEPLINVPSSLTAQAGQAPVTMNISLQNPAPTGGTTVNLVSSDPTKATVTASVSIAAGATTPTTQPTVTGLALGTVSISASATGFASASTSVTVTAGPPASITAGGTPQSVAIGTAFAALTATVKDTLGNPVNGASVVFTAPTGSAPGVTVATTPATTNASGVATATLTANSAAGGPYTVTAAINGLTANYSLTNLSGPPKSIALAPANSGDAQSTPILTPFANPFKAIVKDSGGNPIAGVVVTFAAPTGSVPSGTFAGSTSATATTDASGTATSPALTANGTVSPAGTPYKVTATVNSNTTLTVSFNLTNLSGPPTQIAVQAGGTQNTGVTAAFGTALSAIVKDAGGNPASGVVVTFTAPASGASGAFAGGVTTATTQANGVATAPAFTANQTAGTYAVTATFTGNLGAPATFNLTNNAGSAASITATGGNNQSVAINAAYAPLQATVKDLFGNLVSSGTVLFTVVANGSGAGAKFAGATTTQATVTNGVANTSTTLTASTTVGTFTVNATIAGASTPAAFSLTNTTGPPSTIAATAGTPQNVQAGTQPATALKAVVKDVGGNVLPNLTVTFTVVPGAGGQGGSFAGNATTATASTDPTGTVTMPAFTANFSLGSYTITAAVNGLSANFALTNIPGVPATITPSATSASAPINAAFPTISATVKDGGGNAVGAGIQVVFTVTAAANGASATPTTINATTSASGVAQATNLTANATKGGPYTLTVTSLSATPATVSLTNQPGPVASITAANGTGAPQFTPNSQPFGTASQVTVTDAGADLLSGVSVTFTIVPNANGASGTFAGGGTTSVQATNASGVATAPIITANGKLGSFTVTATAPGAGNTTISLATPFSFTNQSGPPANPVTLGTGTSGQSAMVNVAFATALSATLKDLGGNLAAGYAVTFTAPATGPSGTFAGGGTVAHAISNASGVVIAPAFTANTVTGTYNVIMTVDQVVPPVTATFAMTNTPGAPFKLTATGGTPQNVVVNTALTTPLQVTVADQFGNLVASNTPVTFTAPSGTGVTATGKFGSNTTISETTNAGIATLPAAAFTANTTTGTYTVTASITGVTSTAAFTLTNTAGPATQVIPAASSTPQIIGGGQPFAPLVATVKDAFNNLVTGQSVVFTAPAGNVPSGTFQGGGNTATVNTDSNGLATAPTFTANGFAGPSYNVTATINGATGTFVLTNKSGPAAIITPLAGTTPQSSQLTVAFTTLLGVKVTDAGSNPVSGVTVTFTVVPAAGGASATFTGGLTTVQVVTAANGQASVTQALTPNQVLGTYSVSATAGALSTSFSLTNTVGPPKTIVVTNGGQTAQILTAFTNPLVATVTDIAGNPVVGASVSFTAPASGASLTFPGPTNTVSVTTIAGGVATSPAMTANGVVSTPTYNVTVAAGSVTTTVPMTNKAGQPASIKANNGTTPQSPQTGNPSAALSVTVKDAGGNLAGGYPVTFTAPASGASGYFGAMQSVTVMTNSSGVASTPFTANLIQGGPYTVTATVQTTVPNVPPATFTLTNTACTVNTNIVPNACDAIKMPNISVGQFLQTVQTVNLNIGPTGNNFNVTVYSSDPTQVLVAGHPGDTGSASITLPIAAGSQSVGFYVQGVGNGSSSNPAFLIASGPGYQFAVSNVTLTPSGFVLQVNGNLGGNLVTNSNDQSIMNLLSYQLDSSMNPIAPQSLAGGITAQVTIQDSNASVGTLTPASPITIVGGTDQGTGLPLTFTADPANTGSATLTVAAAGFGTPATGTSVIVTVQSIQLSVAQGDPAIGQSLETTGFALINGPTPSDLSVTLTSSDPTQLLFSNSPSTAGTGTLVAKIPSGFQKSSTFYIQNISPNFSGSVQYTVSAPGLPSITKTATLAASGIIVSGPFGFGNTFRTTTLSTPSTITVETDVLDSGNNPISAQPVAGGLTVATNVTIDNSNAGSITASPVTIPAGQSDATTTFQPNTSLTATANGTISADVPNGFSTPAIFQSVGVTVNEPGFALQDGTVGLNLQTQASVSLGAPAPPGGLQVTIKSNNPNLALAVNPTDVGVGGGSITINIPVAGSCPTCNGTNGTFYIQGLGNSGTATYTASATGFTSRSANVTLTNSGLAVAGPLGLGAPGANESVAAGADTTWNVYSVQLDGSNNFLGTQSLAAGQSATANLATSPTGFGTVPASVTLNGGGTASVSFTFTPVAKGSTNVNVTSSFGVAANLLYHSVRVNVKP